MMPGAVIGFEWTAFDLIPVIVIPIISKSEVFSFRSCHARQTALRKRLMGRIGSVFQLVRL